MDKPVGRNSEAGTRQILNLSSLEDCTIKKKKTLLKGSHQQLLGKVHIVTNNQVSES